MEAQRGIEGAATKRCIPIRAARARAHFAERMSARRPPSAPAPPLPPAAPAKANEWPLWPWLVAGGSLAAVGLLYARSVYLANRRKVELVNSVCARLSPSVSQLLEFFEEFKSEMRLGLQADGKSSMKMIPTFVTSVPTGAETGEYYALDLGGTNFRVLKVKLGDGKVVQEAASRYSIPEATMRGSGDALFDFIAACLDDFLHTKDPSPPPASAEKVLGFTFSFPVRQTALAAGELIRWTKGFTAIGVEGADVVQLLQAAAARRNLKVRVAVLANDTVGTWATAAVSDARCNVGVILGTGSNAAYVERLSNVKKWGGGGAGDSAMVINMEWGNFDSDRRRVLPLTKYDEQLDLASLNPGAQLFEKMLSGMYLGELARRVLVDLLNHRVLCPGHRDAPWKGTFTAEHALQTADLSHIEADATADLSATKEVLDRLHVYDTSLDDRRLVKTVCHLVARRAALLAGTAVAAIASHTGAVSTGCTVAIDGSVYEHYPGFKALMEDALRMLLGEDFAANVKLVLSKDGSGLGAAVLAALAPAPAPAPATPPKL